jgi:hypothetical protein
MKSSAQLLRLWQAAFIAGFDDSILCGGQMLLCGAAKNGFAGSTSESGGLKMAVNEVQLHTAALRNLFAFPQILFRSRKMRCPAAARGAGKQSTR